MIGSEQGRAGAAVCLHGVQPALYGDGRAYDTYEHVLQRAWAAGQPR